MEPTRWQTWGRYVATAVGAAVISAFAFVLRSTVPVFDWIDLGIHELGHMLVMSGPRMLHFLAGSVAQVAFPLGLAAYFYFRQRDLAGAGFCLAWAGTSAWDVSVYIADAPVQALPLVGGGTHDWAYLLGPQGWDAMASAGTIARTVDLAGLAVAAFGIGVAAAPAVRHALSRRVTADPAATPSALPVREAVDPVADAPVPPDGGRGIADDPLEAMSPSAFGGQQELIPDEQEPAEDPWLAASRLPFFHERADDRRS